MDLQFDRDTVVKAIEHARAATKHRAIFEEKNPVAALWLVGDQGVYLMSNGSGDTKGPIAYAKGCDPDKDDFDDWWELKRASFGGDDGVELLPLEGFEAAIAGGTGLIVVAISATSIAVLG